jgi:tRNA(adenine34) deaminase
VVRFPVETTAREDIDEHFMLLALDQAARAASRREVPVGAAVVQNITTSAATGGGGGGGTHHHSFRILSLQHNRVESHRDASAHAELLALRQASRLLGNWRLPDATLYATLEPCPICLSAARAFRVRRIVYGAPRDRRRPGDIESRAVPDGAAPHPPPRGASDVTSGVRREECGAILSDFFRARRREKQRRRRRRAPPPPSK